MMRRTRTTDRADIASTIAEAKAELPAAFSKPVSRQLGPLLLWATFIALTVYCLIRFDFSPERLWNGLDQLGIVVREMFPPDPGEAPEDILWSLLETLAMAFLGTIFAAIAAVPLSFLAARNTLPFSLPRLGVRRFLDTLRGIDQLIWALIFVRAIGLGPLAGIMAIFISDTGTLAKLFSEAVENIDQKPIDGVRAAGGGRIQTLRYAVIPQVLPMYLSSTLYMFESNVRSATILGIVGAGGIGFQLSDRIRAHRWEEVCFILILILVTVAIIDYLSKILRGLLIGKASG